MDSSESPNKKEKEDESSSSQLPNKKEKEDESSSSQLPPAIRRLRYLLEASSDVDESDDSHGLLPEETISMINLNDILPTHNFDSTTIKPVASSSSSYHTNEPTEPLNDLDNTPLGDSEVNPTPTVIEDDDDEFDNADLTELLQAYMGTTTEQNCLIDNPSALERLYDDHFRFSKPARPQRPPDVVLTNTPHRLGLAPKFGESTSSPVQAQMQQEQNRKKTQQGCGCEKSRCLKAVCSCFKAKIACSHKCRCQDCDNSYGQKPHRKKGGNNAKKKPQVEKPWKI